ncbi:MAG: 50S ribosomal protein L23 [Candidatus Paceibacterota bacterium]
MAIFKSKTNTKKADAPKAEAKKVETKVSATKKTDRPSALAEYANILVRPRITEKAANMTAQGVYTFDIRKSATKKDVAMAVNALYKVMPIKVNVVNTPAKRVQMRKKRGFGKTSASRKALVFLKKGDTIRFS